MTGRTTVIIPTFRREDSLPGAIRSVLSEDLADLEVIVIDDSPEHSARAVTALIADARVRFETMPAPTGGRPALVRNRGIELATGDVMYFLDDDDEVVPGGLAAVTAALRSDPSAGVAFGKVRCSGPDEAVRQGYQEWFDWAARIAQRLRRSSRLTVAVIMFRGTLIINSCCAIRRDTAIELGGYDETIPVYEDVEFFTRGMYRSGHVFANVDVLKYRTGMPSIIHDLEGDESPISTSYRMMHDKFKAAHGIVRYRALQIAARLLPVGEPPEGGTIHE